MKISHPGKYWKSPVFHIKSKFLLLFQHRSALGTSRKGEKEHGWLHIYSLSLLSNCSQSFSLHLTLGSHRSVLFLYVWLHAQLLSCVWLFVSDSIDWVCQAPLSMGFSRQEYWGGFPFPPPWDLPDSGIKPTCPESPELIGRFFYHWATREAHSISL